MIVKKIDGNALGGVSATALWTLRNRAVEALRLDAIIEDSWAVRIYEAIDYDYEKFGKPSQAHPLRALAFDRATRRYLTRHPRATVVALAEGLQTAYWRIGNSDIDWLSIDLGPVIDLREQLLPQEDRISSLGMSVLDRGWMDRVDPSAGVFISAEGLFMYLEREEVVSLIADCARRFPGGQLMFDSIPKWFSDNTMRGWKLTDRYTVPPMPFSLSASESVQLAKTIPAVAEARDVLFPAGRALWRFSALRVIADLPLLRDQRPSITLLEFVR